MQKHLRTAVILLSFLFCGTITRGDDNPSSPGLPVTDESRVEVILGKISDNYALIKDMAATITDTSQVGDNPPKTALRNMAIKPPDKTKMISPDVTIITDGDKTTIKEPG